ncbi:MAG: ATP-dependent DNA helicase RecG, partial [Clostridia bacterium]|nr:ATP-dependent DNA helicase RecG [Clostridia bacterium]
MLNQPVSILKGVGKVRQTALHNIGIDTIGDLLNYYPRAYEDRTKFYTLEDFPEDVPVCIKATVGTSAKTAVIRKGFTISKCKIFDEFGAIEVTFFNRRFIEKQLFIGKEYVFFGKISRFNKIYQMQNPDFEAVGKGRISGRILPIYPLTEGITRNFLTDSMASALANTGEIVDDMPESIVKRYNLTPLDIAIKNIHFPSSHQRLRDAINRLCFNELITYSSALAQFKSSVRSQSAPKMKVISLNPFLENLPYELTGAQKRAVNDIFEDMYSGYSMNRLVQGDVGSGKTVVAAAAAYLSA